MSRFALARLLSIVYAPLLLPPDVSAQSVVAQSITLTATPASSVSSVSATAAGPTGGGALYYWVVARYPAGLAVQSQVASVFNSVGAANLSVTSYVVVSWSAMPGATAYDVIRSTSNVYPAPCASCAVSLNNTNSAFNDQGGALSAYPPAGLPAASGATAQFTIDNISATVPLVNVNVNGTGYRLGLVQLPTTSGHCAQFGANGLIVDSGSTGCGGGAGLADPGANGVVVRTALNVTTARTLTAGTGISISNGNGVSGNPTITNTGVSTCSSTGGTITFTGCDLDVNFALVVGTAQANDLTGQNNVTYNYESQLITNDTGTGTTTGKLAIFTGAPSTVRTALTSTTRGIIGGCVSGCTNSGTARIATRGNFSCVFDGATTAGDYVIASTSTAGDCSDAGSTRPYGQVVGFVLSTNVGAGTYQIDLQPDIVNTVVASGTSALGTGAISANVCATVVTTGATGVLTTDAITFTPNADISAVTGYGVLSTDGLKVYPYPTANNVNFKVCNGTGSSITPGAVTLNWMVTRR